jgi:hypothetical protein
VVLANMPIKTVMVTGLPSANGIFETIDTGKKRSLGHVLARAREENYSMLAAAIGWLWRWERGTMLHFESPRHDEAVEVLKRHPQLRESCHAIHCCNKVIAPGVAAFLHYIFSKSNSGQADWFFHALGTGEDLSKSSPKTSAILRLREILIGDKNKRSRRHAYAVIALAIKAWNCVRKGVVCKQLRWTSEEDVPEVE